MTALKKFLRDDAGAVTIDWVALTAGILLLGVMVGYGIFGTGVGNLATSINDGLSGAVTVTNADITEPNQTTDFGSTTAAP